MAAVQRMLVFWHQHKQRDDLYGELYDAANTDEPCYISSDAADGAATCLNRTDAVQVERAVHCGTPAEQ